MNDIGNTLIQGQTVNISDKLLESIDTNKTRIEEVSKTLDDKINNTIEELYKESLMLRDNDQRLHEYIRLASSTLSNDLNKTNSIIKTNDEQLLLMIDRIDKRLSILGIISIINIVSIALIVLYMYYK